MRKYCYKITMKIFPVYFTALLIAIVIFAVFFGAHKAHAQKNEVALYEISKSGSTNLNTFTGTTLFTDIIVDETKEQVEFSLDPAHHLIKISSDQEVTNMVVYDRSNNVVEDVVIDVTTKEIDFSNSCPGIYYVRVDYIGGSHLKRMVVQ